MKDKCLYVCLLILCGLLISFELSAQQFYVNTSINTVTKDNKTYLFSLDSCQVNTDTSDYEIFTCADPNRFNDIAVDHQNNIWYLNEQGELYKRNLNDSNCQYIGRAPGSPHTALVADTVGNIYLAGGLVKRNNIITSGLISKYDGNNFSIVDTLPIGMYSAGDLFFYEDKLFLTAASSGDDSLYLAEININAPQHSCYYMSLDDMVPWAAFSTHEESGKDRVFIMSVHKPDYDRTTLIEIDIPNKKILDTICTYPFIARGAAARFPAIWTTTSCPTPPASISQVPSKYADISILNPTTGFIRINSSMTASDIATIELYNTAGTKLKAFQPSQFPNMLDVSEVSAGLYILHVKTRHGGNINKKLLVR